PPPVVKSRRSIGGQGPAASRSARTASGSIAKGSRFSAAPPSGGAPEGHLPFGAGGLAVVHGPDAPQRDHFQPVLKRDAECAEALRRSAGKGNRRLRKRVPSAPRTPSPVAFAR